MNNKGSFKNEGTFGKRLLGFFKESGFYIAIVVGLCALAAGAVFFSTNQILTDPEKIAEEDPLDDEGDDLGFLDGDLLGEGDIFDESSINDGEGSILDSEGTEFADEGPLDGEVANEGNQGNSTVAQGETPAEAASGNNTNAEGTQKAEADDSQSASGTIEAGEDDTAPAEAVVLAIVKPTFKAPISGKIQAEYSMDKLVFSPTFNEWRTHSGVDIASPRGEVVRAVGNGAVSEIKNDPRYGFTVVIDHKNGYKSLYANLASDKNLKVGQEVKQGDAIGSVGATAIFESAEPTHIHFELYKENKLVDPAAYIEFQ